ncbi:MAG: cysteine desulfurase family protein [Thermoanaerobaculia bacterium]
MIYFDNNASTKLDPGALSAMEAAFHLFGNPSSLHAEGRRARRAVEDAREEVARLVGAEPAEIYFTSGGTEANAMAIYGATAERGGSWVRSGAEHPSVREAAPGVPGRVVDPDPSGALDAARVVEAIDPGTALVSVMSANNEYGGIFPVGDIARGARARGALVHTDAVQAAGRVPIDVRALEVDLLSVSAHKLHGPRGAGALFIRKGVRIAVRTPGGGQEKRLRGGTENTPALVGFGVAARLAGERLLHDARAIGQLRDRLERSILEGISGTRAIGAGQPRLPNTSAILFEGALSETLLMRLDLEGVAVSAGSACSSGTLAPSPAILALGFSPRQARQVIRFSLSRDNTAEEVDAVLRCLPAAVAAVRQKADAPGPEAAAARSSR